MTRYERHFRSIAKTLGTFELTASSVLDERVLESQELLDKDAGRRFLDFYGDAGLDLAFQRYGLYSALRRRGYDEFELQTRISGDRHDLRVLGRSRPRPGSDVRHRLVEVGVRRERLIPYPMSGVPTLSRAFDVLIVDWLLLEDPLRSFTRERPRLPGQEAPGLGIGERVLELLYRMVERLELEGLATIPEHLHNALIYSREMSFFDPVPAGRTRALEELLIEQEGLTIAQASWAVEWGLVRGSDDASVRWKGDVQVTAFASELRDWLRSDEHLAAESHIADTTKYVLDRRWFDEQWSEHQKGFEGAR